jgi:hypothetical protein
MNGPAPEAGCNCEHLPDGEKCVMCSRRDGFNGQTDWTESVGGLDDELDDDRLRADGGTCDWYRCTCGARYRSRSAALRCCSGHSRGTQPVANVQEGRHGE